MNRKELCSLLLAVLILGAVVALSVWGFRQKEVTWLQGQVEATEINVSPKVPGRIKAIAVKEGDSVQQGQLLVELESTEIDAKLDQALAAKSAAEAQSRKAQAGARVEQIQGAYNLWQQAKVAAELAEKTYVRINNLYKEKVVPEQKRDEAQTNMEAMRKQEQAALSQYDMARNGTRTEDKEAAEALVEKADAVIAEVESYKREAKVYAPLSGEIETIIPNLGEIVNAGYPVVNLVDLSDIWVVFNIREDRMSRFAMGARFTGKVPAIGNREVQLEVRHIAVQADYATWNATSATGDFDRKTFEIKAYPVEKVDGLRPGMSVLVDEE